MYVPVSRLFFHPDPDPPGGLPRSLRGSTGTVVMKIINSREKGCDVFLQVYELASLPGSKKLALTVGAGGVSAASMHHVVLLVGWFDSHDQVVAVGHQHVGDLTPGRTDSRTMQGFDLPSKLLDPTRS